MTAEFECLCFLDNSSLCILEIKHQEKFVWLLLNKLTLTVKQMNFGSIDHHGDIVERYFDLGYLKYDPSSGVFIEKYNSGQHPLENKNCSEVPEIYLNSIAEFLNKHFTLY
ncbi:hypothetical protein ACXZ1K_14690 [Pedobacter sp. PWIIR3]